MALQLQDYINSIQNKLNNPIYLGNLRKNEQVFLQNLVDTNSHLLERIFNSLTIAQGSAKYNIQDIPVIVHFISSILVKTFLQTEKLGGLQFIPVVRFLLETLIEIIEFSEGTNETERDSVVQTSLQLLETNPVIKSSITWIFYRLLNLFRRK